MIKVVNNLNILEIGVVVVEKLKGGLERGPVTKVHVVVSVIFVFMQVEVHCHFVVTAFAGWIGGIQFLTWQF